MKNRSDAVGSLFLFLLGLGAIIGAIRLKVGSPTEPQPGFFPFLGGLSLAVFSTVIFIKGWVGQGQEKVAFGEIGRPALLLVVMIALVAVLDSVGYVIGTFIASVLILRILNAKSWRTLLLTSLCLSIGTYILFDKLLGIDLPVGILARLGL
ncbi:MAG TPA: tripartite tricarboxylate transporter TctB family protein [Thermodesulfobacteriota bacterium]|nr:tripartite tricarboxylate transporter TctB family protein [Thermodesulfobacteriota bacterium]